MSKPKVKPTKVSFLEETCNPFCCLLSLGDGFGRPLPGVMEYFEIIQGLRGER